MSQRTIDLLPDTIRARSQARQRTGRFVAWGLGALLVLVALATHARIRSQGAERRLEQSELRAARALALEKEAERLRSRLAGAEAEWERYELVAMPVDLSRVMATVINQMPESMTLDSLNLDARRRRTSRSSRSKDDGRAGTPPRILTAELTGFAPSDETIAQFVEALADDELPQDIALDYSRARVVRGRPAREFRLSFRMDLETPIEVRVRGSKPAGDGTLTLTETDR